MFDALRTTKPNVQCVGHNITGEFGITRVVRGAVKHCTSKGTTSDAPILVFRDQITLCKYKVRIK
jgi:hypothetical protein